MCVATQVIQHFPSENYTIAWVGALERSAIAHIFLEVRQSKEPKFSDWAHGSTASVETFSRSGRKGRSSTNAVWKSVMTAVMINCEWLAARLKSYRLDRAWNTMRAFQACEFTRAALPKHEGEADDAAAPPPTTRPRPRRSVQSLAED